jgi:hypothetical protein
MLVVLGSLPASKTAQATAQGVTHLLNYAATHPDAALHYLASYMILHVHSDTFYQSEIQAQSCAGGCFFLSSSESQFTTK